MYSNYMLNVPQYGVDPVPQLSPKGFLGELTSSLQENMNADVPLGRQQVLQADSFTNEGLSPIAGGLLGFMGNSFSQALSQYMQYQTQTGLMDRANSYNSPSAMMRRMVEAGINPNAAAQGIAGAPGAGASQTPSVGLTSNNADLADLLANSTNTALGADVLRAEAAEKNANAKYTRSQTFEQDIRNKYADLMHNETLKNLVYRNQIDREQATIIAADAKYAEANAFANWMTTCKNLEKIAAETKVLEEKYYTQMAETYSTLMAGNLSAAQIKKVFSDIGVNAAIIRKIESDIKVNDAEVLLKGQQIKESEARTIAQNIQNQFQQDYYDLWQNTGWDMNSSVDMNMYRMIENGEIENYERFLKGMSTYIYTQGDARSKGKDYTYDKLIDVFSILTRAFTAFGQVQ